MADDTEIERMLEEKMNEDEQAIKHQNGGDKKEKEKEKDKDKKHKKHKHHKHHKSHKSEKKHERKRSRSPINDRRRHSPPSLPTMPNGKRRDVNSELHQLAQSLNRPKPSKDRTIPLSSKSNRREKSPELTPEERDLRTVFCKKTFFVQMRQTSKGGGGGV
jgi:hypothetical protein